MTRYLIFLNVLLCYGCHSQNTTPPSIQDERLPFAERTAIYPIDSFPAGKPQYVTLPPLPDTLTFAGERVPLERDDVRESLERELVVNTFGHSRTIFVMKNIARWRPLVEKTLRENDVPTDLIYLAVAESELENTVQSPAGAVGMWQFMQPTARDFGLTINEDVDMRRDPKLATEAATRYLKWAYVRLKSWPLVASSYNRGLTGMQNVLKYQQTDNFWDLYLNPETARYFYRILAFKVILENPEAYGYFLRPEDQYRPYQFKTVKVDRDTDLIAFAKANKTTYKELRLLNPWFSNTTDYRLRVPSGSFYEVRVPTKE
ncbi:lytic transglycosylase domain-containing protein [Salmonirosea aquatica]|uniref:Transglycosylase SLT domain-containing protein n=1 Tax=Salmonirosea aquatica TaxID=2654236 RepID=A0A7C9FDZ6_9BACT|nr:transglycosylase SLT domain-containing protein [Cytophagaceae bacterium SJW1-29]